MKNRQYLFLGFLFIILCSNILAQDFTVPRRYSFRRLEDFRRYESDILRCIEYLEQAPVNDLSDNRRRINSFLLEWLTDVPYVQVRINSAVMDLCRENTNFLIIFMGGWVKYSLSHSDDNEIVNGYLAGIESILRVYQRGNGVIEDSRIEGLIVIQRNGKLRDWVLEQL